MIYLRNCVSWPEDDIDNLSKMIDDATDITRSTFLKHVNRASLKEIEQMLGYSEHPSQGLTMAGDWHVSYHRSKLNGKRVYYFRHSAIEYVFSD